MGIFGVSTLTKIVLTNPEDCTWERASISVCFPSPIGFAITPRTTSFAIDLDLFSDFFAIADGSTSLSEMKGLFIWVISILCSRIYCCALREMTFFSGSIAVADITTSLLISSELKAVSCHMTDRGVI